ncbi:MAG: AraC family transcriptional regulator [bacterium]
MSINDISATESRFTPTSQSQAAPACMSFPGCGRFYLTNLTLFEKHEGSTRQREHRHEVFHLVLFCQADNEMILEGRKIPTRRGLCLLTAPGEAHCFLPRSKGITRYHAITFAYEGMESPPSWLSLLNHYTGIPLRNAPSVIQMPESAMLTLPPLLASLREPLSSSGPMPVLHLHLGVLQLFAFIAGVLGDQQVSRTPAMRSPEVSARGYLDANYARAGGLAAVAAQAGVTPAHLGRLFKHRYGVSPGRYRDALRLDAARNLLRQSDLLVKEIAFQTGYPDAYTFSKAFRRHCHCTPRAYRSSGSKA